MKTMPSAAHLVSSTSEGAVPITGSYAHALACTYVHVGIHIHAHTHTRNTDFCIRRTLLITAEMDYYGFAAED